MGKNIYTKLMEVRVNFHKLELKKSGLNKFAGFKYYELSDFLVPATKLLQEANLCPIITFNNELATMTLINGDNPEEQIIFTSPMRELELKGTNAIQNLGGIQTYLTRYLYIQLMNLVETDLFDSTSGKDDKGNISVLSEAQLKRFYAIGYKAGYENSKVDMMIKQKYNKEAKFMSKTEYDNVVDGLEKIIKKTEVGA